MSQRWFGSSPSPISASWAWIEPVTNHDYSRSSPSWIQTTVVLERRFALERWSHPLVSAFVMAFPYSYICVFCSRAFDFLDNREVFLFILYALFWLFAFFLVIVVSLLRAYATRLGALPAETLLACTDVVVSLSPPSLSSIITPSPNTT